MTLPRCAAGTVPVVRLALAKQACARHDGEKLNTIEKAVDYIAREYGCLPQEYMLAVACSSRMTPLSIIEVAIGGVSEAPADPKVVFAALLLSGATAFLLFHNHPSGDPEPSEQDVALTRTFNKGGLILGLRLVDHIVVGGAGNYRSFQAMGLMARL